MIERTFAYVLSVAALLAATAACADEESVKKAFQAKFPKATVDTVTKLPDLGLYEIVIPRGDEPIIIYTDDQFRYMFQGNLVETKNMVDLTEKTRAKLTAIDFNSLPLDKAIKKVKGNGSRKIAVFSDPDCPFCKRIEQEFEKVNDVTIYILLYPIEQLHPKAVGKAKQIWCSPNRQKAWDEYMLKGTAPTATADCDNPVEALMEFGRKRGINGTPTLVFADGSRVPGALTAAQLEAQFSGQTAK
jgi:thiol:disulfide interchange protein DsbC